MWELSAKFIFLSVPIMPLRISNFRRPLATPFCVSGTDLKQKITRTEPVTCKYFGNLVDTHKSGPETSRSSFQADFKGWWIYWPRHFEICHWIYQIFIWIHFWRLDECIFFVFGGSTGKEKGRFRTTFGGKLIAGEVLLSFGSFRPRKLKNSRECKIFLRGKIFSFDAPFWDASNFRKQQIGSY